MSGLKALASQTVLYGVSTIAGRMLNYLLVPFYTAFFDPAAYGIVTDVYAFAAFLNVLATFGLETTYFRFASRDKEAAGQHYSQAFSILLAINVLLAVVLVSTATPLVNYLEYPSREIYIYLLAFIVVIDGLSALPLAWLRLQNLAKKFVTVRLSSIFANVGLNLAFIYGVQAMAAGSFGEAAQPFAKRVLENDQGVILIFIANLLSNAIMLPLLYKALNIIKLHWNKELVAKMLRYGYPIILMGLAGMVNEMLGRLFLKKLLPFDFYPAFTPQEALGIYGACYKLAVFMTIAIQAFRYAAEPFFFNKAQQADSKATFAQVMTWFVIVCSVIMVVVCLNMDWIALVFLRQEAYRTGLVVVPILLLANLFLGVYYNLSIWFKLTDKTHYGSWISIGGALLTIALNILLIPVLGYTGSALATLLCYALMAAVNYLVGQKHYPIPYEVTAVLVLVSIATALCYVGINLHFGQQLLTFVTKQFIIIGFLAGIWWWKRAELATLLGRKA